MTIMNLVFDFGGVVFRWAPHEFLQRLLPAQAPDAAAAQRLSNAFFESFGGDWAEFDRGTLAVPALAPRIAARTGLSLADVHRVIAAVPHELQPLPDMVALLDDLRTQGHRLFYLSNMPAPYADHLEAAHPFLSWFEAGVFSGRVQLIKPEPAVFALAERQFGVAGRELLFIDDVQRNVAAALAAGWNALQFENTRQVKSDLQALIKT